MTRCSIGCMEPGCHERIQYDTEEDAKVPLYCRKHRTEEGRHSETRVLCKEPKTDPDPIKFVELHCYRHRCYNTKLIPKSEWDSTMLKTADGHFIQTKQFICDKCGMDMLYHHDIRESEVEK